MKRRNGRILALGLALLLALGCAAQGEVAESVEASATAGTSAGWREGTSPAKPYAGVPEVDLTQQLGYMMLYPTRTRGVENSCQKLFVYLPRMDVKEGEGKLYLYDEEGNEVWQTQMNDEEAVRLRPMSGSEQKSLMWSEGMCFEITLPKSLDLGKTYFVNMERGCIWTTDDKLDNPEVGGSEDWRFKVEGEYGVSAMEYRRVTSVKEPEATSTPEATLDPEAETARLIALANGATPEPTPQPEIEYEEGILHPQSGDEIRFDLTIGGEAAMAVLYGYNGTVDFPIVMYEQSGEVCGKVLSENPAWGVIFLDAQGNELNKVEFR